MSENQVRAAAELFEKTPRDLRRQRVNRWMRRLVAAVTGLAVLPLIGVTVLIVAKGVGSLSPSFLLNGPLGSPPGILNAIQGSLLMTLVATLMSAPIGIAGGVYLNEYASSRVSAIGEYFIDVMLGVPSILAGLFAYLAVVPILGFSGWAATIALSVLMVPVVMRTTQEVMRLVPAGLREASLALGVPMWKTTIFIVCRTAFSGLLTGVVLAISRGLGETAPLLLTSLGSNDQSLNLGAPMNAMTVVIYNYAGSSDPKLVAQAWTTALVLFAIALVLNVGVRFKTVNSRVA
jgi:phosphate transport system permease protein